MTVTVGDVAGRPSGSSSILGHPVRRTEDPELLIGAGSFASDIVVDGMAHVAYARSSIAHGRIVSISTDLAREVPGVLAVLTADDLDLPVVQHPVAVSLVPGAFSRPPLARGTIRFVGEVLAVVVADSLAAALDGAAAVILEHQSLPVVLDPEEALAPGAVELFPEHGGNVVYDIPFVEGAEREPAPDDIVIEARFVNQRIAPAPVEPHAIVVLPDGGGVDRLTVHAGTQMPHNMRDYVAGYFDLAPESVRVVAPHIGGGFGAKTDVEADYVLAIAVARALGRPVRYVQQRTENLTVVHARDQVQHVRLVAGPDGRFRELVVRIVANVGAYPGTGAFLPFMTKMMATGVYRFDRVRYDIACAVTNTAPVIAFRGAGRPEAAALIERAVDMMAARLGLDTADLRRRNLLTPDAFPYETATGSLYDSGAYEQALDRLLDLSGYGELRADQAARRASGDRVQLGIGLSVYVEITAVAGNDEHARVEIGDDGRATVYAGTSAHGQGHRTTFAQIVAESLRIPFADITVVEGDTDLVRAGGGTQGSRSVQIGGSAVLRACDAVLEAARETAAHALEAAVEDIELRAGGTFAVVGAPVRALSWAEVAGIAADPVRRAPAGPSEIAAEPGFGQAGSTFPFGAHLAVVEVDTETGRVELQRLVAVDDCGTVINPLLATGQVHGGLAAGVAQALWEQVVYDPDGTPRTTTFADYAMPSAAELPGFETDHTVTPTPLNPLGAKGIGESGTVGSTPAVQNAVVDALVHLGVAHIDLPITPERVWRAVAGEGGATGR